MVMRPGLNVPIIALAALAVSACTKMSQPLIDVREHIYSGQPLWQSAQVVPLNPLPTPPTAAAPSKFDIRSLSSAEVSSLAKFPNSMAVVAKVRPGLAMIARQVFTDEIGTVSTPSAAQQAQGTKQPHIEPLLKLEQGTTLLLPDNTPLPEEIATLNLTKVIVGAAIDEALATHGLRTRLAAQKVKDETLPKSIPQKLSLQDFVDFGEAASRSLLAPYQEQTLEPADTEATVKRKTARNAANRARAAKAQQCAANGKLAWECLFKAYMISYFNGDFVDRNGGTYSKPKIGLTITNETITSAVAIFLEALFDISLIDADVKAPVVYSADVGFILPPSGLTTNVSSSGGQFRVTQRYYYVITATNTNGETRPSEEIAVDIKMNAEAAELSWPTVPGATSYTIYRTGVAGTYTSPSLVFAGVVGSPNSAIVKYTDIGTAVRAGSPPSVNTTGKVVWMTKDGKTPTLANLAKGLNLFQPTGDPSSTTSQITYLIERFSASATTPPNMDGQRLCVVRLLGGLAGDVAQPLTGVVVRALGGANLGFTFGLGALGKFSFGDNDTLAKLIDTIVENFPRRLTEATVEHALYGDPKHAPAALQATLSLAASLSGCTSGK